MFQFSIFQLNVDDISIVTRTWEICSMQENRSQLFLTKIFDCINYSKRSIIKH